MKKIFIVVMVTLLGFLSVGISTATANDVCGTGSPGYWMNHPEAWGTDIIPVPLVNGTLVWTKASALEDMKAPTKGDKWLTLWQAAVAGWLNKFHGCPSPPSPGPPDYLDCATLTKCWKDTDICDPLEQAFLWLVDYEDERPVKASSERWQASHGEDIYMCLDAYNNGELYGIPSRDSHE